MSYSSPTYLTAPVGNNQFAYAPRKASGNGQLFIPALQKIHSVSEVQLANEIVFAEMDTQGNVKECTGLAALYLLEQPGIPPLRIMDNHNHALYAWVTAYNKNNTPLTVVHIDQHADLGTTLVSFDMAQKNNEDYLRHYTNEVCTIASFIQPLDAVGIVHECIQVRTSTKLHEIHATQLQTPYILDIDLDFFALPQEPGAEEEQIMHIQTLLPGAQLCTIATSPYFLEQQRALQLLYRLLKT